MKVGVICGGLVMVATAAIADPSVATVYTDRAQWFQLQVSEGWIATKAQGSGPVLTVRSEARPTVHLTLEIRRLAQLPELITREALLEQAQALLKAVAVGRQPASVTELTGRPMTGLIADYADIPDSWARVTILLDPPRQRAFVWTATAPAAQFPQYDATFDQIVAGLVPTLPES